MSGERIETPIGRTSVFDNPKGKLIYGSEADLRDGLAALAWINGWTVRTEVKTATGSFCDLLLESPYRVLFPVELKTEITTLGVARRGFQQADDYRRHFNKIGEYGAKAYLSAVKIDRDVVGPVADLHDSVDLIPVTELMSLIRGTDTFFDLYLLPRDRHEMRTRADERRKSAEHVSSFARSERALAAREDRWRHIVRLDRNYPAMASMLCDALGGLA